MDQFLFLVDIDNHIGFIEHSLLEQIVISLNLNEQTLLMVFAWNRYIDLSLALSINGCLVLGSYEGTFFEGHVIERIIGNKDFIVNRIVIDINLLESSAIDLDLLVFNLDVKRFLTFNGDIVLEFSLSKHLVLLTHDDIFNSNFFLLMDIVFSLKLSVHVKSLLDLIVDTFKEFSPGNDGVVQVFFGDSKGCLEFRLTQVEVHIASEIVELDLVSILDSGLVLVENVDGLINFVLQEEIVNEPDKLFDRWVIFHG